jgi:hypothetical protein
MTIRHLIVCAVLAGFVPAALPFTIGQAEAAQPAKKKKQKTTDHKKQEQQRGKKKYPWGEPNAGWDDHCIYFFNTYDGWIPPVCRPYGRTF